MNVEELKAKMEASGIEDVKVDTETGEVKKVYETKPRIHRTSPPSPFGGQGEAVRQRNEEV